MKNEIKIKNSVKSIGYSAFSGCHSLTSVTIPKRFEKEINNIFNDKNLQITFY